MSIKAISSEGFLLDVKNHRMTVKLDDGAFRHLLFRQAENSWNQWFEIVTWPGSLAIHGDMGTWTFSRVDDMFTFFRSDREELKINAYYWHEKIQSESRFGGPAEQFDVDTFKANVLSSLENYDLEESVKATIAEELNHEVFAEKSEDVVRRALADYKLGEFHFSDTWEISGNAYSDHFLWCLHAIVWAIRQYDNARIVVASKEAV